MYGRGKFSQSRQMKDLFYSIVKAFNRKVVFISWELSIISVLFFGIIHRPCLPSIGLLNIHLLQFVKTGKHLPTGQTITSMVLIYFLDRLSRFLLLIEVFSPVFSVHYL